MKCLDFLQFGTEGVYLNSTTLGQPCLCLLKFFFCLDSREHFLTVFRTLKALLIRAKNDYNLIHLLSRKYSNLYFSPNWIDSIFVRAYEDRMDLLRAVIMGPAGTPYHDGLFFFDIYFPPQYPHVPPVIFSWLTCMSINYFRCFFSLLYGSWDDQLILYRWWITVLVVCGLIQTCMLVGRCALAS